MADKVDKVKKGIGISKLVFPIISVTLLTVFVLILSFQWWFPFVARTLEENFQYWKMCKGKYATGRSCREWFREYKIRTPDVEVTADVRGKKVTIKAVSDKDVLLTGYLNGPGRFIG